MDAHYDEVMKRRTQAANAPPRLYFAYSTVLDRAAFEEWKGQHGYESFQLPQGQLAEAVDLDFTFDFPSRWWGGRVAGLVDRPGSSVFGLLFEIAGPDWAIIQHKEGAVTGMCVERDVTVKLGGTTRVATAFTTNPARKNLDGPISPRFMDAFLRGGQSAGLPADYLDRVKKSAG